METIKALGLNFIFGTLQHPRRHLVAGGSCSIRSMKIGVQEPTVQQPASSRLQFEASSLAGGHSCMSVCSDLGKKRFLLAEFVAAFAQ
ncbi:hypothetical protein T4A_7686 [Trichinella pseudospiralis]|uniref:Uncharacterized protein n=1 Tax=Trichinella pseudospiralis TaxID=6337 RepID=A0A0V1FZK6_TRIPS|nr:hypothetical protein T4E_4681 [Trichinella pseudospiralis]KRY78950.1 hypothetical protein T4A_7686 [Trichinella pseudospiralis]KRY91327.1 hypothetical protein T4D_6290 [Trichinella pseudospiralis]